MALVFTPPRTRRGLTSCFFVERNEATCGLGRDGTVGITPLSCGLATTDTVRSAFGGGGGLDSVFLEAFLATEKPLYPSSAIASARSASRSRSWSVSRSVSQRSPWPMMFSASAVFSWII